MSEPTRSKLVEMVREYRKALWEITRARTKNPIELRAIAALALRSDFPSHHEWCAEAGTISANTCGVCAELWKKYPYDPAADGHPHMEAQ